MPPVVQASRADPDFLAPPAVIRAERDATGAVALAGRSQPEARVNLLSPTGERYAAQADGQGGWTLVLPGADAPRAFAVSATDPAAPGRIVRAEGALLVTPSSVSSAVFMRGGAPAWPVAASGAGLRWATVDMDAGGGAAVSGFAPPGTVVRLSIDGLASGAGEADATGRFGVLWLGAPVPAGTHAVSVATPSAARTLSLRFAPAAPLDGAPARFTRESQGWRVDWAPAGGGGQTTLALDAASGPGPASAATVR